MAIYKGDRGFELGTTENKSSERSGRALNAGPPDYNSSAFNCGSFYVSVKLPTYPSPKPTLTLSKSHNRTERESKGVGRDILIFRTMRTTRKQFPVNWLTSGRLAFTIQRAKARGRQQIKKWRRRWRDDVELINWPSSTKNLP